MRPPLVLAAVILIVSPFAAEAAAADSAPDADTAPKPTLLAARVIEVEGTVESRPAVGQPWKALAVGSVLAPGTDLRTGFRAHCVLDMTDSLVQIDPLSVVRIAELQRTGDKVRTRLYLKQGHTQSIVEKGRIESDFAILTPSATLAVKGTRGIECGYFPVHGGEYGLLDRGLIGVTDAQTRHETNVRPGQNTNDRAVQPLQHLADRYVPIAMDRAGLEKLEKRAAQRWRTAMPAEEGLKRRNATVRRSVQEVCPDSRRTLINTLRSLVPGTP